MKIISKISNNRKLKTTLLLAAILAAACVLAGLALWLVGRKKSLDMTMAYDVSEELYGNHGTEVTLQKTDAYASQLCVGAVSYTHLTLPTILLV